MNIFKIIHYCWSGKDWSVYDANGEMKLAIAPAVFTHYLTPFGYSRINKLQHLKNDIVVYPMPIFVNSTCQPTAETYAVHINTTSWIKPLYFPSEGRGPVFKFCKRLNLHKTYSLFCKIVEKIRK